MNLQEFNKYVKELEAPKLTRSTASGRSGGNSGGLRARLRNRTQQSKHGPGSNGSWGPNSNGGTGAQKGFRPSKSGFKSKTTARVVKPKLPAPEINDSNLFPSLCVTEDGQGVLTETPVSMGAWSNGIESIIAAKDLEPPTRETRSRRQRTYSSDYSDYSSDYEDDVSTTQVNETNVNYNNVNDDNDSDWENF